MVQTEMRLFEILLFFCLSQISFKLAAGEVLEGVYVAPQDKEESRKNVEQVLQFISSRHIRMPHISARGKSQKSLCFLALSPLISRTGVPNLFLVADPILLSEDLIDPKTLST